MVQNSAKKAEFSQRLTRYAHFMRENPLDIPAFQMRDVPILLGPTRHPSRQFVLISDFTMLKHLSQRQIVEIMRRNSRCLCAVSGENTNSIKLEMKSYLQPFEQGLAMRELRALLNPEDHITEEFAIIFVTTNKERRSPANLTTGKELDNKI